jgi:uncharacterized protein (TIGR00290 family)
MKDALVGWSSGKDSAWALHVLRQDPSVNVVGLFTSVNEKHDRVAMHGTRSELLRRQAALLELPLFTVNIPDPCTNELYEKAMGEFVQQAANDGVQCMAFGDLYLEDIRKYRVDQLAGSGIEPIFPLWHMPTAELADTMLSSGLKAYITCVDLKKLPADVAGQQWSKDLLAQLPADTDPCCENGEMHTVAVAGPMFSAEIPVEIGETVIRGDFAYADVIPLD